MIFDLNAVATGRIRATGQIPAAGVGVAMLCLALLFGGCPSGHIRPDDALSAPADVLSLVLDARSGGPRTVAIEARASQYGDQGAIKGKLAILLRRPASVHFSGLSPTDDVVSVLATDGTRFSSFQRGADVCYVGPACPENVGRMIPIAMPPAQLLGVLLGQPPLLSRDTRSVEWDRAEGAYLLELAAADGPRHRGRRQQVWVQHGSGRVVRTRLLSGGEPQVDLRYRYDGDGDGDGDSKRRAATLPQRIDIWMAQGNIDLRLDYRRVDVDLPLSDSAFAIPCPVGMQVRELICDSPAAGAAVGSPRDRTQGVGDGQAQDE